MQDRKLFDQDLVKVMLLTLDMAQKGGPLAPGVAGTAMRCSNHFLVDKLDGVSCIWMRGVDGGRAYDFCEDQAG